MVGRPREFDTDQVLEAAMRAFWAKGYESTSLTDLVAATGLHKGSLYQAFGDKHSLFVQALQRYLDEMLRLEHEAVSKAATPLQGLKDVLHGMIDMTDDDDDCPMGCLAVNSLIEMVPHDEKIEQIMANHMGLVRSTFGKVVSRAQAAGEIGTERSADVITAIMMTFMAGLATTVKGPLSKSEAHELLDMQLDSLL